MIYRCLNGWEATDDEWNRIEAVIEAMGWMPLNKNTSRILIAEQNGGIVAFSVVQMMPVVGPLYVAKTHRGSGLAESLADMTLDFLKEVNARGWVVAADNPFSEELCKARGMVKLDKPVYVTQEWTQ